MEHEYELNEYIEKAAASKGNNSPQTPTITLNGKGVAVLASVIIVILLTILALLIANIAIFWPIDPAHWTVLLLFLMCILQQMMEIVIAV